MSLHLLVTLFVLVSLAATGSFVLALTLAWRNNRAAHQSALEQQRRLAALRQYHRRAERRIDQITMAAIEHVLDTAQKGDRQ